MQFRLPNAVLERKRRRFATFTAALCLVCFALAQGASQLTNTKRITALALGESAEGSRVTVTGDSLLDDYEAFRRGDRFYVRIPAADFVAAQPSFQGKGFEDVQVQKVGDGVVISFRLHPGANARVIGSANRLDVIFTSPNTFADNSGATAVRNRVTRKASGEKSPSSRGFSKAGPDVAGPMPPASPVPSVDYTLSNEGSTVTTGFRSSQRTAPHPSDRSSNAPYTGATPTPAITAAPLATPYPTSSPYSANYPPAGSTYTPALVQPATQTNRSFDLEARGRTALQWVRTNKTISGGAGIMFIGLLGVVLFFLYRRRQSRRAAVAKASRVQPNYSLDDELEDMLSPTLPSESSKVGPGRYVDLDAYDSWNKNISTENALFNNLTTNTATDVTYDEVVAPSRYDAPSEESWEHAVADPLAYNSRVQEREVFEL